MSSYFNVAWDILHATNLCPTERLILHCYWMHTNRKQGVAWLSLETIVKATGSTKPTIHKWRKALVEKGYLDQEGQRRGTPVFRINTSQVPHPEVKVLEEGGKEKTDDMDKRLDPNRVLDQSLRTDIYVHRQETQEKIDLQMAEDLCVKLTPEEGWDEFNRIRMKYSPKAGHELGWSRWSGQWLKAIKAAGNMTLLLEAWEMLLTETDYRWWREVPSRPYEAFLRQDKIPGFVSDLLDRKAKEQEAMKFPAEMLEDTTTDSQARIWISRNRPRIEYQRSQKNFEKWLAHQVNDKEKVLRLLGGR